MRKILAGALACALLISSSVYALAQQPTLSVEGDSSTTPSKLKMNTAIIEGTKKVSEIARDESLSAGDPETYGAQKGVLTFRGGPERKNASYGEARVTEGGMTVRWSYKTNSLQGYTGFDWTGQPVIVKWHREIREMMNLNENKINVEGLKEVIYPSMDGLVYFLDLADGEPTRTEIDMGYPMKASAAVDPRGYPLLYVGQGISKLKSGTGDIGLHIFSLIDGEELYLENGRNKLANITNGAVDASALILKESDTLVFGGENGLIYTVKLGTDFPFARDYDQSVKEIAVTPQMSAYRYKSNLKGDQGIESSVAVYGQYLFAADNMGLLQCVDMDSMECLWAINVTDNTDATVALDEEDGALALYTANTLRKRTKSGDVTMRRVDALTGKIIWETAVKCTYKKQSTAGAMASPIVGEGALSQYVLFTLNQADESGAVLYALNKSTGEIAWQTSLGATSWSSPIALYTQQGTAYVVQGADDGKLRLYDGANGNQLASIELSGEIVASPAAYSSDEGTMVVVGTTDGMIYGVEVY